MKKFLAVFLSLALMLTVFSGCAGGESAAATTASENPEPSWLGTAAASEGDTITVTDHSGYEVTLPRSIERIAITGIFPLASVLTVFFNSASKLVAIPEASMTAAKNGLLGELYPEILNAETACVSGSSVNTEELLKLEPDVVFYSASDSATGDALRAAGFAAVGISVNKWDYDCIETLAQWIELLDTMFPEQETHAEAVRAWSEEARSYVQERVQELPEEERARIFVMFQYSETNLLTSGENFFGQWWCESVGAVNVAQELAQDNSVAVNLEQVYAWNPGVILVTNFTQAQPADILESTIGEDDWSGIQAVQDGRVYKMPLGLYRSYTPGADVPVTLYWLAKTVYPELFADLDVTAKAQEYYAEVFGVELTNEQIESIFAPVSEAGKVVLG